MFPSLLTSVFVLVYGTVEGGLVTFFDPDWAVVGSLLRSQVQQVTFPFVTLTKWLILCCLTLSLVWF